MQNENITLIRRPTESLKRIMFGNGSEAHMMFSSDRILNDGTTKKSMALLTNPEFRQQNHIETTDLNPTTGLFEIEVDGESIVQTCDDALFPSCFCSKTPYNEDTIFSKQHYIKQAEIKYKNLEQNYHILQIEMGKTKTVMKQLAQGLINEQQIADMIVAAIEQRWAQQRTTQ